MIAKLALGANPRSLRWIWFFANRLRPSGYVNFRKTKPALRSSNLRSEASFTITSSYQNPVGGPDPYEKFRVEPSQERQKRGDDPDGEPPRDKSGLAAHILELLQKAIDYLVERYIDRSGGDNQAIRSLEKVKNLFEVLKKEDRSQDIEFLNELSKAWNQALEESFALNEKAAAQFKILVKKILHYPENETHTFGYYLTEYAGQKWIPFPYMELIQKIHSEHEKNPKSSPLVEWTKLLTDTLHLSR